MLPRARLPTPPRTLFLMPTLSITTGTTGWFLAKDMGFTGLNWPQYAWIATAVALVVLMAIQGLGYLLPANLRVSLELQRNNPDPLRIARLTNRYFMPSRLRALCKWPLSS